MASKLQITEKVLCGTLAELDKNISNGRVNREFAEKVFDGSIKISEQAERILKKLSPGSDQQRDFSKNLAGRKANRDQIIDKMQNPQLTAKIIMTDLAFIQGNAERLDRYNSRAKTSETLHVPSHFRKGMKNEGVELQDFLNEIESRKSTASLMKELSNKGCLVQDTNSFKTAVPNVKVDNVRTV